GEVLALREEVSDELEVRWLDERDEVLTALGAREGVLLSFVGLGEVVESRISREDRLCPRDRRQQNRGTREREPSHWLHLPLPPQLPLMQGGPAGQQGCPLAPHGASQPFNLLPSRLAKKFWHVVNTHAPALHATPLAFNLSQLVLQAPQLAA